jgi:hypothetical protein
MVTTHNLCLTYVTLNVLYIHMCCTYLLYICAIDLRRVAAELGRVLLDPLQHRDLVHDPVVGNLESSL